MEQRRNFIVGLFVVAMMIAMVSTACTSSAMSAQRIENPSCWYRRSRSRGSTWIGVSSVVVAPHEPQRRADLGFLAPHAGQLTIFGSAI